MARGGKRTGTPGTSYGQRTDLNQPVKVAPNLPYGQAQAYENAQRAVPLPNQSVPAPAPAPQSPPTGAGPTLPSPDFARPTERPAEPVTAGLPTGPGPGPEILGQPPATTSVVDQVGATLRALYGQATQNGTAGRDLLRLIELHDQGY